MSTYALAIPESYAPRPATYGTRAQLAGATGDVEGYLALAGCDKRAGTASYALRIVNQSETALRARMTCATLRGESILAYPLDVHIAPFSVSETLLPVRIADVGPYDRAIVQIEGGPIAFSLEAPAPARVGKSPRWIAAAAAAVVFTIASACAAAFATPRLALLAAPERSFAGTTIDVPYAFGGWAALQYALSTRDGRQITAGLLRDREGTIHFAVPPSAGSDMTLSVNVTGPLGRISTVRQIAIVAPPPVHKSPAVSAVVPRISAFAVATPNVRAGELMRVTYITNAHDGEIWLIDENGQLWAREVIAPQTGETDFKIPQAAAGKQLHVVLHARIGAADTVANAVVTVLPGAVAAQPPASAPAGDTLTLSADRVTPGQTFTVTIAGEHTDAAVVLTDQSGNQVQQGDIAADQDAVTLTAPAVETASTYYVTANIAQGNAQQTVVRKITVEPAH
ncbi:MAG TPA: hypothetical protein VGZ02_00855 [Candidatus Baltobacteraceae bacterium]|jgi:hypothetical protein|nr:hypothetical protein [Candidatus Baltobacteraceae bacterium]